MRLLHLSVLLVAVVISGEARNPLIIEGASNEAVALATRMHAGMTGAHFSAQTSDEDMTPPVLASGTSACESTTITVTVDGNDIRWFSDEGLTILAGSGNSLDVHVAASDTILYAIQMYGDVKGPALAVELDVYRNPSGAIEKTSGGLIAPEGTAYKWFRNDELLADATQRELVTDIDGRYKVLVNSGPCAEAEFETYIVHAPVLASDPSACQSSTITVEVSGDNVAWFADEALTIEAGLGNLLDVTVALSDTTLYAVQTIDSERGPALAVEIKVFQAPTGEITKTEAGLTAPEGTGYKWFINDELIADATERELTTDAQGRYKVLVTNGPCVDVEFVAYIIHEPILTSETSVCQSGTIAVEVSGDNVSWFKDETLTIAAGTGNTLEVIVGLSDTTVYAVQTIDSETGPALAVEITVFQAATGEITKTETGLTAPEGTAYMWFRNDELIPGATQRELLTDMQGYYKVLVTNGPCIDTEFVTYIIHEPVLTSETSVCESGSITLEVSGDNVAWFKDEALTVAAGTGNALDVNVAQSDTTLYAVQIIDSEKGPALAVEVEVVLRTAGGIIKTTTGLLAPEGTTYIWFRNDELIEDATQRELITDIQGRYKVVVSNGPCETEFVTYFMLQPVLISETSVCQLGTITVEVSGDNIVWYEDEALTIEAGSGNTLEVHVAFSDTTFYAVQTMDAENGVALPVEIKVYRTPTGGITTTTGGLLAPEGTVYSWSRGGTPLVNATQRELITDTPGFYEVIVTNGPCEAVSFSYSFQPPPPTLTAANAERCVGDSQSVTATGTNISWFTRTGEPLGSVPGPQIFTIQSVTLGDTVLLASQTVNLAESQKARATWLVIDYPGTAITVQGTAYQAAEAGSYQWFHNDEPIEGATLRTYTPEEDGVYYVEASNRSCKSESDKVTFTPVANAATEFTAFYNPATQTLYVNAGEQVLSSVKIYDMSGRRVQEELVSGRSIIEHSFSLTQVAQGVYIVHIETEMGQLYRMRIAR